MPVVPTPHVVGIDDWVWRRGQRYGTLIVDLERNRPVDVLPGRDAQTVGAWLNCHPGIEVVARDRAGAYADGVRTGAPEAVQVSDRWHLLRNLGDAVARVLDQHHGDLRAAAATAVEEMQDAQPAADMSSASAAELPPSDRHAIRRGRFNEAMALHGQGWPARRIARVVGVTRAKRGAGPPRTVARIVQKRAVAAGHGRHDLGGHSLKRGAMTTGMDRGVHPPPS